MKTYPYIGQAPINGIKKERDFDICLFHNTKSGTTLEANIYHPHGYYSENWNEGAFKNITAEYLANTYGEVKSKEHAEFIVSLNSGKESSISELWSDKIKYFIIDGAGKLCFSNNVYTIDKAGKREITIPLPPEPEETEENNMVAAKYEKTDRERTLELMHECYHEMSGDFYDFSQKFVDMVALNECESVNEWPKVGSKVTWGNCSHTAEVIAIHNNMAWLFTEGEYHTEIAVSKLQKPKTPEQELRDLLLLLWEENNHDFDMLLDVVTEHVIKKPQ